MAIATVLSITGRAWARDEEGNVRELSVGDTLQEGEVLVTSDNGSAQLDFGDGLDPTMIEGGDQIAMTPELATGEPLDGSEFAALDEDLEALLTAIDEGEGDLLDLLEAPAAGPGAGGGGAEGGGHSFVRLARIAEEVNPLAFEYGLGMASELPEVEGLFVEVIAPTAGTFDAMISDAMLDSEAGSVFTGTLPFSFGTGVNGSVTFADMHGVTSQVGQETLSYSWDGASGTLTATSEERGEVIFTIEVNTSTGEFTLTQVNNLLHEEGTDEALTGLVYTVTSTSGTATGTLNVTIVDDEPTLELGTVDLTEVSFVTEDSDTVDGVSKAEGSVALAFQAAAKAGADYGADDAGSVVVSDYALVLGAIEHELISGDVPVVFTLEEGVVIGRAGDIEVLRIEINTETGEITVTQSAPVDHPDPDSADTLHLPTGLVGVKATVTVTDADHDSVSDTLNADLSGSISILDDVPTVTPDTDKLADLQVEEGTLGEPAIADFSGAFIIDHGADGEGSTRYSLSIEGDGVTGLLTTESGQAITLFEENGTIIGKTADDQPAFTISVDATTGEVTLTQHLALSHPDEINHADMLNLANSGLTLNAAATDSDGDTTSVGIDLGSQLSFVDDGPVANHDLGYVRLGSFEKSGDVMKNDTEGADGAKVTHVQFGDGDPVALIGGEITIQGKHGKLTIYEDGDYTYVRTETPDHQGLFADQFTYTLTDGDGDTDTATLTVGGIDAPVILKNPLGWKQDAHLTVNEANLEDGTNKNEGALTQSDSFFINAVDGLAKVSISLGDKELSVTLGEDEAVDYKNSTINGDGYTLTITGITKLPFDLGYNVSYAYTLEDNKDHSGERDNKALIRNFTITATDRDGDTDSASLKVKVVDDAPEAEDDTNAVVVGKFGVSGNVITGENQDGGADQEGADGAEVTAVRLKDGMWVELDDGSVEVSGDHGTLTINSDGSYTYVRSNDTPNDEGNVSDVFEYRLTDGDGDEAEALLTINVVDSPVEIDNEVPAGQGAHLVLNEAHLSNGSAPQAGELTQGGSFMVTVLDGLKNLTVGGEDVVVDGVAAGTLPSITTTGGNVLAITGFTDNGNGTYTVSYEYTLNTAKDHEQPGNDTDLEQSFVIVVEDTDGDTSSSALTVQILDDAPEAEDDSNSVAAGSFDAVTGNVITENDTQGADGATVTAVNGQEVSADGTTEIAGSYGTLTIAADGSYSYVRNAGTPGGVEDAFVYTLTDGDDDTGTATLTITIENADVAIELPEDDDPAADGNRVVVDEAWLTGGSAEGEGDLIQTGSFTVTAPDGVKTLTVGGEAIVEDGNVVAQLPSITTPEGNVLTVTSYDPATGVVEYSYTLNSAKSHDQAEGDDASLQQNFVISVEDLDGDTATSAIVVEILDDVPQADDDEVTQEEENAPVLIDVFDNDKGGADGVDLITGVALVADSLSGEGELVYNNDGTFTYSPAGGEEGEVTFQYTITDADGDHSTATVTINLEDDSIPTVTPEPDPEDNPESGPVPQGAHGVVSESALQGGSGGGSASYTGNLNITHSGNDTTAVVMVGGVNVTGGGTVTGTYGTLVVSEVNGEYSWTYTLTGPATHSDADAIGTDDQLVDTFDVVVTDSDGTVSDPASLVVAINDDGPQADDDEGGTVTEDAAINVLSGNVLGNDKIGADGHADLNSKVDWIGNDQALAEIEQYGTLVLNSDGTWSFELDSSLEAVQELNASDTLKFELGYTITDADGDSDNAVLRFSIQGATNATLTSVGEGNEDHGLVTYTVTLDEEASADQAFKVTLSNGQEVTITVEKGATSGDITLAWGEELTGDAVQLEGYPDEDVYLEEDFELAVTEFEVSGEQFGELRLEDASDTVIIDDTIDTTTVSISATVTKTSMIDVDNVEDTDSFTVTAYDAEDEEAELSIVTGTNHDGFGVHGETSGSADERELGYVGDGKSESIVVEFKNEVQSFDVQFAWRNNSEQAKVEFFDADNNSVGWAIVSGGGTDTDALVEYYNTAGGKTKTVQAPGGSDKVDLAYTFEPGSGEPGSSLTFTKAVFTAVGEDDDYLIHSIAYREVMDGDAVSIPSDEISEVTFEIQTSNPPDPDQLTFGDEGHTYPYAVVRIGGDDHIVQLDSTGRGTVTVLTNGAEELTAKVIAVNGNFEEVDVPVSLTLPIIEVAQPPSLDLGDDVIVVNEKFLKDGPAGESQEKLTQDGVIQLSAEGGIKTLTIGDKEFSFEDLQALDGESVIELESGNTLTLTGFDGDINGGELSYEFTLNNAIDHAPGEERNTESKAFDITLEDKVGQKTDPDSLTIKVVDDIPQSFDNIQAIQVPVSELEVDELNAGWKNVQGTSGSGNITTSSNANGISMQWGGNGGSGYEFAYADGLTGSTGVATDSLFSLGAFTHNNFVINANQKTLDTVDLEVTFNVMIDGVLTEVTTTIKLDHDETPNDHSDPTHSDNDDIIKIVNPDQEQTIQVGDREYVLKIRGFLDDDRELVDTVYTTEDKASKFELYAEIVSTDDLPIVEGKVEADWGADGKATEGSLLWANGQDDPLASGTVVGEYGTLTVDTDGNYSYIVSREARDGMKAGESYQDEFTYYLTDADGDVVESKLTIELEGVPNGIVASDDMVEASINIKHTEAQDFEGQPFSTDFGFGFLGLWFPDSTDSEWDESHEFNVRENALGEVSFTVLFETPGKSTATVKWDLYRLLEDGSEILVNSKIRGPGFSYKNIESIEDLETGSYRIDFQGSYTSSGFFGRKGQSGIKELEVVERIPASSEIVVKNVTEQNILNNDIPGSGETELKALKGDEFVEVEEGGLTVNGQYGTFVLFSDGSYEYTPNADVANVGKIDSLTYQLVNLKHDTTAEATLHVGITGPGVDSFEWGSDADDTLVGTAGNDILVGGDGADTFKWNLGDQADAGEPAATDTVQDFEVGVWGEENVDRLDLADLLQGEEEAGDDLSGFIMAVEGDDGITLYLNSQGQLGGDTGKADQVIQLEGKKFADFDVVNGPDASAELITKMITDGQLNIDQ